MLALEDHEQAHFMEHGTKIDMVPGHIIVAVAQMLHTRDHGYTAVYEGVTNRFKLLAD